MIKDVCFYPFKHFQNRYDLVFVCNLRTIFVDCDYDRWENHSNFCINSQFWIRYALLQKLSFKILFWYLQHFSFPQMEDWYIFGYKYRHAIGYISYLLVIFIWLVWKERWRNHGYFTGFSYIILNSLRKHYDTEKKKKMRGQLNKFSQLCTFSETILLAVYLLAWTQQELHLSFGWL